MVRIRISHSIRVHGISFGVSHMLKTYGPGRSRTRMDVKLATPAVALWEVTPRGCVLTPTALRVVADSREPPARVADNGQGHGEMTGRRQQRSAGGVVKGFTYGVQVMQVDAQVRPRMPYSVTACR